MHVFFQLLHGQSTNESDEFKKAMERVLVDYRTKNCYSHGISLNLYSRNKQEFELKQKKNFKVEWLSLKLKEKGMLLGHSDLVYCLLY